VICAVAITISVAAAGLIEQAPAKYSSRVNPLKDQQEAAAAGAKLFARECAACHGPNREGIGNAPPLKHSNVVNAPPGALYWVLRNGSLGRGMPSFAHLPEAQRWQIISFLRSGQKTDSH
jgi:mono/diheme cytochrome c family protein